MFRNRRFIPLLLIATLCLAPLTVAEAGSLRGSKLVASPTILDWAGQLWQRMLSVWGQEGASIDPSGGNPPINTGNGSTAPPPIDPSNG